MRASDLSKTWGFSRIKSSNSQCDFINRYGGVQLKAVEYTRECTRGTVGKLLSTGDGTRL